MITVPSELQSRFENKMRDEGVPNRRWWRYKKWLRYYLDFCQKYRFPAAHAESLQPFLRKLEEKKQTPIQQEQAAFAIHVYYDMNGIPVYHHPKSLKNSSSQSPPSNIRYKPVKTPPHPDHPPLVKEAASAYTQSKPIEIRSGTRLVPAMVPARRVRGASWRTEFDSLSNEIQVRHYSPKTLKTYVGWMRKFQTFTHSKDPGMLSADDVKRFLTELAVKHKVASSTQNQAFNALLFFYRHVLQKEFGKLEGVVRAKRKEYIPVVLSREEIDEIVSHLAPPVIW
jgi:Phage integrase, N-terminal SAM-like domain